MSVSSCLISAMMLKRKDLVADEGKKANEEMSEDRKREEKEEEEVGRKICFGKLHAAKEEKRREERDTE